MCNTYNGYENYATWAVSLWLNNEYGDYLFWTEEAQTILEEAREESANEEEANHRAVSNLAERIKDQIEEHNPLAESAGMYSDLMGHALASVNWWEVARSFVEE